MRSAIHKLLAVSMLLLPFSTPAGDGSVVVSFAIPTLAVFGFLFACSFISRFPAIPTHFMPLFVIAAFYVTWTVICALIAPSPVRSLGRASVHVLGFLILLHSMSSLSQSLETRRKTAGRYLHLSIISGCTLSIYFILTFALAVNEYGLAVVVAERWVGGLYALSWGASNTIAACLLFPVMATIVSMASSHHKTRLLAALLLLAAGIVISLSRNAGFCLFLYLILAALAFRRYTTVTLLAAAVIAWGLSLNEQLEAFDATESSLTRFVDPQNLSRGFGSRVDLWRDRVPLLPSHLFVPIGYYGSLETLGESSHNALITTVLEQGAIGIILYVLLVAEVTRQLWKSSTVLHNRREHTLLLLGIGITLLNLQFEDPHFTQVYIIYWWFYLAICVNFSAQYLRRASVLSTSPY